MRIEFAPEQSQTIDATQVSESPSAGEWQFSFENGSIATSSVRANIEREMKNGDDVHVLRLLLNADQAKLLEQQASRQDSVRSRRIPDEGNEYQDTTDDKQNTVYVVPPNARTIEEGAYRILEWKDTWKGDKFEVRVKLGRADTGAKGISRASPKTASLQVT